MVGAVALTLMMMGSLIAYHRHAIADFSKTDFDEVTLSKRRVLVKGSAAPFSGILQARDAEIAALGAAIFADTPVEKWTDANPEGLILEVPVVDGYLSGGALLYADLRSEVIGELKSGLRFTLAKWFSPRQKVASASFVASQLDGGASLWRPVGSDLDLRKYVEAEFQANVMHGSFRRFHESGALQAELRFDHGVIVGKQKEFYASGELEQEILSSEKGRERRAYYRNGELRSQEIIEAEEVRSSQSWFPDGSQRHIAAYQYGFPQTEKRWYSNGQLAYELLDTGPVEYPASGVIREYHDGGALKSEHHYVDGVMDGPFQIYYANAKLWEEGRYVQGSLEGRHRKWWKNGVLALEAHWQGGEKNGSYQRWYASGKVWEKADYEAGTPVGPYIKRWKNGELAHDYEYVDGHPEGSYTTFYDNGQARLHATYKNGKLDGEYKNWLRDGRVYELATYQSGTKVKTSLKQ